MAQGTAEAEARSVAAEAGRSIGRALDASADALVDARALLLFACSPRLPRPTIRVDGLNVRETRRQGRRGRPPSAINSRRICAPCRRCCGMSPPWRRRRIGRRWQIPIWFLRSKVLERVCRRSRLAGVCRHRQGSPRCSPDRYTNAKLVADHGGVAVVARDALRASWLPWLAWARVAARTSTVQKRENRFETKATPFAGASTHVTR